MLDQLAFITGARRSQTESHSQIPRIGIVCLSLFCIASTFTSTASASTIFQENFSGATSGTYGVGNIAGTQITVMGGNVDIVGAGFFTCDNNPTGRCLDLIGNQGFGSITSMNTLSLTAGHTYDINFGVTAQGGVGNLNFVVGLGMFLQTVTATPTPQNLTLIYTPTVSQSLANLRFTSSTNVDNAHGPVLDNIAVIDTGVTSSTPEPATTALVLCGLLGCAYRRFRSRGTSRAVAGVQ